MNGRPKNLKFGGASKQEAFDALVFHLENSDLHNLSKSDACEIVRKLEFEEIVEDEDKVHQALPAHARKRSNKEESSSDEVPVRPRGRSNKEERSSDESPDEESANPERRRRLCLVAKRTGGSDHDVPPSERDVIVKESYWITAVSYTHLTLPTTPYV